LARVSQRVGTSVSLPRLPKPIPANIDPVCPEHEHWQLRTQCNPLIMCSRFHEDDYGSETNTEEEHGGDEALAGPEEEDLVVEEKVESKPKRAALVERDTNVVPQGGRAVKRVKA